MSVTLRSTEPLDATTAANGGRLASVTASGTVVHTSTAQPLLSSDGFTLTWTLTAADWTALTTQGSASQAPAALSVAATSTLRSTTYGISTPVLPATPEMLAKGNVYSTSALPLEIREPLTLIASSLTSAGSETPYELTDLAAAGIPLAALTGDPTNGMLISPFQAQPFADPFTGKTYIRARWYDPGTGTWLTPDPLSYQDSSNLYAFCAGDPVNCSDPTGLMSWADLMKAAKQYATGYIKGRVQDSVSVVVGVVQSLADPISKPTNAAIEAYTSASILVAGYRANGLAGLKTATHTLNAQAAAENSRQADALLQMVPGVKEYRTYKAGQAALRRGDYGRLELRKRTAKLLWCRTLALSLRLLELLAEFALWQLWRAAQTGPSIPFRVKLIRRGLRTVEPHGQTLRLEHISARACIRGQSDHKLKVTCNFWNRVAQPGSESRKPAFQSRSIAA